MSDELGIVVKGKRYLRIDETAAMMHVSRRTIYNWIALGKVKAARGPSGSVFVVCESIEMTPVNSEEFTVNY